MRKQRQEPASHQSKNSSLQSGLAKRAMATRGAIQSAVDGRKILFVDDDPDMRSVFRRTFRYTEAEIDFADCPKRAIELAQSNEYCVVLTDLQMPGMTGLELVDRLWAPESLTSYILVTGVAELDLPTDSPSARAISSMVRKPWLPENIDTALIQAIELHDRRLGSRVNEESIPEIIDVLVVDNGGDCNTLTRMLETPDNDGIVFRCQHVSRLLDAMRILRDRRHNIILTDLSLPDARGLDAVAGLKRAAPRIPIVVLSRSLDEELAIQAVKAGAQDYLVEGEVSPQSLRRTVRYAIERKSTEEHLAYLEHHDQLTGLANRTLFSRRATTAIAQALGRGTKLSVLLLDLDNFKITNDILGHSIGDLLLSQVADRIRGCLDDDESLARLGGDEFAILLEESGRTEEASSVAQRLLNVLRPDFLIQGHNITIGGSIGIAVCPDNGIDIEQLLGNADTAMYRAKGMGRGCYQFFDQEMHLKAVRWMELERALRGALERDEFELHYQPQINCQSNKVVCFEALLRWTHHTLGPVGPFHFIPVLEGIGLIDEVGTWVLKEACRQLSVWRQVNPNLRMAVNVSAIQFENENLVEVVRDAVTSAGLPAAALELEITEGLLMKDYKQTLGILNELSEIGIRVAIDDFGTGYSNLSYMAKFPIDLLKIDKSITDLIGTHQGDSIARAVVQLSHALNIEVLAEGVEETSQLTFLEAIQVESYQGYLFSKPLNVAECEATLETLAQKDCQK